MTPGISFDDLIPKAGGGGKAPQAPLSFDDLVPKSQDRSTWDSVKHYAGQFASGVERGLLAAPETIAQASNPVEGAIGAYRLLTGKDQTPIATAAGELAGKISPELNPENVKPQNWEDRLAQTLGETAPYAFAGEGVLAKGGQALAKSAAVNAGAALGMFGANEAVPENAPEWAKTAASVVGGLAGGVLTHHGVETARPTPAVEVSAEAAAKPVMEAGSVDEAIATAKEVAGVTPTPRVVDFSDLIPTQEVAETHPVESRAAQESVSVPETAPSTLPKEAASEAPQAISFDDLVDQGPVTLREAEPQPGEAIPASPTAEAPLTAEDFAEPSPPVDQGLFRAYNNLAARHETYSRWVNELTAQRDNDPRIKAAQAEIDTILAKVKGNDQYLTKKAASRIEELRGYINDFRSVDTPDMVRVKKALAENYNAMLAMGPEVKAARQAVSNQASKIYGDKASVIDADELWQAGVKDGDAPDITARKLSEFRSSLGADKLASEHGVEIASDARQLPPHEYAELRRHGYEPINVAGPRIEELAGISKAAEKPNSVTEVAPTGEGLGRAPAEPRELPIADHPEELTAKAPEGPARPVPVEPTPESGTLEFKTAKGSTYRVNPDGTTTRNKSYHPEHGAADQGPQPKSERTYYVTDEQADALSLFQTEGDRKAIAQRPDGSIGVKYLDGPNAGKFERRTVFTPAIEPAVGLTPVELWKGGERVHFGNKITEISKAAETKRPFSRVTPVQGTGDVKARGLSESIEATAIEKKLTDTFGNLPEYQQVSMADQAVRAQKLVDTDFETAKAVAMGQKAPPRGTLPESVLVAVERKALEDGDVETIHQLATQSRLMTEATTMGQRIRSLGERDKASPVAAIQAVQDARAEALKARKIEPEKATADTVRVMRKEVRKTASRQSWNDFIVSITCGNQ